MSYSDVYNLISESIANNDVDVLEELITLLDLDKVSRDTYKRSLLTVIRLCYNAEDLESSATIITEVIRVFEEHNETDVPVRSMIFALEGLDDAVYEFILKCYPAEDFYDHVNNLFSYSDDVDVYTPLERLHNILGPFNDDVYSSILESIEAFHGTYGIDLVFVRSFFVDKRREVALERLPKSKQSTTIPSHSQLMARIERYADMKPEASASNIGHILANILRTRGDESSDSSHEEADESICNDEVISDSLTLRINEAVTAEDVNVSSLLETSSGTAVSENVKMEVFRVLGPCNPSLAMLAYDKEKAPNDDNPCRKFGGCRMMTCWEYVDQDIDEDELDVLNYNVEWFTGTCDHCNKPIEFKHEAVRTPVRSGGWIGCFHDWNCVALNTDDAVQLTEIERYKKQYEKYGIQARIWPTSQEPPDMPEETFLAMFALLKGTLP